MSVEVAPHDEYGHGAVPREVRERPADNTSLAGCTAGQRGRWSAHDRCAAGLLGRSALTTDVAAFFFREAAPHAGVLVGE